MTFESSDYELIRERAEKRLEPMKKLRWMRLWFFINFGLYLGAMRFITSNKTNDIFYLTKTDPSGYPTYTMLPLVYTILIVWVCLLFAHLLHVWSAYRHERAIQREVERESLLELERLRLEVELARGRGTLPDEDDYPQGKVKRTVRLSDDGELLPDEAVQVSRRAQR